MVLRTRPVDSSSWEDVASVLGPGGGSAGCWCTFWRLTNQETVGSTPESNQAVLHAAVMSDGPVGLVGYHDDQPVGWCSVGPRTTYKRVFRTKGIEPAEPDDAGVWSIVCVFVKKESRGTGLAVELLRAAAEYAGEHGARVVEAYPVLTSDTKKRSVLSAGTVDQFTKAGFDVFIEPSVGKRLIMRRQVGA